MDSPKHLSRIITATALAMLFGTSSVYAQTGASSDAKSSDTRTGSAGTSKAGAGKVSKDDQEMMEDIAHANLAEIETGKMALEKSQNEQVKKFAQMMIDDHTKAFKELEQMAQSKGVNMPSETDVQHKTIATALKALSGETFDNQYIERVGVGDHERTIKLLQKNQKNAKDADLKAYAKKTLAVVEGHLKMAKQMEQKKK